MCLNAEAINSSMYQVYGTSVYTDRISCRSYSIVNLFTMNDGGTLLCVTRQMCLERNLVLNDRDCVAAAECPYGVFAITSVCS